MALSTRLALLLGTCLALVGSASGGCRGTDLCATAACESTDRPSLGSTDSGAGGAGGADDSSRPLHAGEGGAGQAGAAANGAGEGGVSEAPPADTCEPDLAECDGSSLTPCETNLTWSVRHCGECQKPCDGLCQGGICEPAQLIWEGFVSSMVVSTATGFAVAGTGDDYALLQVNFKTADPSVLLGSIAYDATLAVSIDRIYALDVDAGLLHSARLDGSDLMIEKASERLQTMGATADGAYYVDYVDADEPDETTDQLWFRAAHGAGWALLHTAPGLTIVSSSPFGLLLEQRDAAGIAKLFVVHGDVLDEVTDAPADPSAGAVTRSGVVLLTTDDATGESKLWWRTPDEVVQYEISSSRQTRLHVMNDQVALYFDEDGSAFVQQFTPDGPILGRGGLPTIGDVVSIDFNYAWYTVADSPVTWRFLRAKWRDFDL